MFDPSQRFERMPRTTGDLVATARIDLPRPEHEALLRLAAHHERSARAEAIWAVRQYLKQHADLAAETTAS